MAIGNYNKTIYVNGQALAINAQNLNKNEDKTKELDTELAAHMTESMIHAAGGTANAIIITTGGSFQYTQGNWLQFKATANNTGNVTLNVDGKGTKPFLKVDGSQIAAGGVKTPKVYKAYYDTSSGGRFFLLASAEGDAVAGDVLAGKTFSNDDDTGIVGTMPNRGSIGTQDLTSQSQEYTVQAGYHNGAGKVRANITNLTAGNVRKGATVGGVAGTYSDMPVGEVPAAGDILSGKSAFANGGIKISGSMTNRTGHVTGQSISNTGTTLRIRPQQGYYPADSANSVQFASADWLEANIVSGKNIFGKVGSFTGKLVASGTASTITVSPATVYTVSGLSFTPSKVICIIYANDGSSTSFALNVISNTTDLFDNNNTARGHFVFSINNFNGDVTFGFTYANVAIITGGFKAYTMRSGTGSVKWWAYE